MIPAYILAGGKSSRFGADKARAIVDGRTLLEGVASTARAVASSITVVADAAGKYNDLGFRTIADTLPDQGPLGGLYRALADAGEGWVLVLSCDLIGLDPAWLRALTATGITRDHDARLFATDPLQPLLAVYHTDIRETVAARIAADQLSMHGLVAAIGAEYLPRPANWAALRNVNRPADL